MEMKSLTVQIAKESWPLVETDLNWFVSNGLGKKIYLSQVREFAFSKHLTINYLPLLRTAGHLLHIRV